MKSQEIEKMIKCLDELNSFANQQDYNTTSYINERVTKIRPVLEKELERVNSLGANVHSPMIMIFTNTEATKTCGTVAEYMNLKLSELVSQDKTIIDFGKLDEDFDDANNRIIYFFIKYNN